MVTKCVLFDHSPSLCFHQPPQSLWNVSKTDFSQGDTTTPNAATQWVDFIERLGLHPASEAGPRTENETPTDTVGLMIVYQRLLCVPAFQGTHMNRLGCLEELGCTRIHVETCYKRPQTKRKQTNKQTAFKYCDKYKILDLRKVYNILE